MAYQGISIVDYLKSVGKPSDFSYRANLAKQYGISGYRGTAKQNLQLLNILKSGTKKPQTDVSKVSTVAGTVSPTKPTASIESVKQSLLNIKKGITGVSTQLKPLREAEKAGMTITPQTTVEEAKGYVSGGGSDVLNKWNDYLKNYLESLSSGDSGDKGDVPLVGDITIPKPPAAPDLAATYTTLRTQEGIDPLENELNDINARIDDLNALYEKAISEEEKRLAPMTIIRKRQAALSQEQQDELRDLVRQKNALVDQLNMKYNNINTIMDLKKQDYKTARDNYEWEYNKAFQIYQNMDQQASKDQTTAKANWQTLINSIKGEDYSKLPEDFKLNLKKLELAAGLPAGISEMALRGKSDKTIRYSKADNGKLFILYDDGTSEIRDMGIEEGAPVAETFFTKTDYKNLSGLGVPKEVADTISVALQEGLSLEAIRRALAEEYGREKGYHYLDVVIPYLQKE